MIIRKSIFSIFILLFLQGCFLTSPSSNRKLKKLSEDSITNPNDPTFESASEVVWNNGSDVAGTLTINQNNTDNILLRGQGVNDFLNRDSNYTKQFCLMIGYNLTTAPGCIEGGSRTPADYSQCPPTNDAAAYATIRAQAKDQLRLRAIPDSILNFSTQSRERFLRIDLNASSQAASLCSGPMLSKLTTSLEVVSNGTDAAYRTEDICPTCSGTISSTSVSLYSIPSGTLYTDYVISSGQLDLSPLGLRVDLTNTSSGGGGSNSCTDAGCITQGYDCCSSTGSCVNNGQEKPNAAASFPTEIAQARADKLLNINLISNYPHIFYQCSNTTTPPVDPTPPTNPDEAAQKLFDQNRLNFLCMQGGALSTPDYSSCCLEGDATCDAATYACFLGESKTTPDYSDCSPTNDLAAYNTLAAIDPTGRYNAVKNYVRTSCGCTADPNALPPLDPDTVCPAFTLQAEFDAFGEVTNVSCLTPEPPNNDPTFQILNLTIDGRTAPHRFFKASDGLSVDDISTLQGGSEVQEGDTFSYLDNSGKSGPQTTDFNMNAIIGQFSVNLDQAKPAKAVDVVFDESYVIQTNSGFYNPCPTCKRDAWFSAFTSHPEVSSGAGRGLEAVAYTSSRDSYLNNLSAGNYEDTIFGRACWLPPTMIPYTHASDPSAQTQRLTRLKTQAALYMNGYQRDWFGFNKGAVIGSFNGVTWFAIGKGRRVRATSDKLFLAVNAGFLDLADNSTISVSILKDNASSTATTFDYDFDLAKTDARQNGAATCQAYHSCDVDRDCVTKLGWEYICTDINQSRTLWPVFDSDGNELAGQQQLGTISNFLVGGFNSTSSKRCVYRGAGSVCKKNFSTITNEVQRKAFACAPNFYCADLGDSMNGTVIREPDAFSNILFGQDADILGRPTSYVGGSSVIPTDVRNNLIANASNQVITLSSSELGICRPGKSLVGNSPLGHHQSRDNTGRTDYISQVSSCNSAATGNARVSTCPLLDDDGEHVYTNFTSTGDYSANNLIDLAAQNACGAESLTSGGSSPFDDVEADRLASLFDLITPKVAKDACFRRAGSPCNTDLDCSPGKLHEDSALAFGTDYFGDTTAERRYWQESLICGQGRPAPNLLDPDFSTYDLTLNRCCRAVGNDFTMYTEFSEIDNFPNLVPDMEADNSVLVVDRSPINGPRAQGRYSRYQTVDESTSRLQRAPGSNPTDNPTRTIPMIERDTTPQKYQWKTINDTGKKNCCGGGWIRKFADGTHDWTQRNRLNIDIDSFRCLNNKIPLELESPPLTRLGIDNLRFNIDAGSFCLRPDLGGCTQYPIYQTSNFEIRAPGEPIIQVLQTNGGFDPSVGTALANTITAIDTTPLGAPGTDDFNNIALNAHAPYEPIGIDNGTAVPRPVFIAFPGTISFYFPAYIGNAVNIQSVRVRPRDNNADDVRGSTNPYTAAFTNVACPADPTTILAGQYCISADNKFYINYDFSDAGATYAGVAISFVAMGSQNFSYDGTAVGTTAARLARESLEPGNSLYYDTKLARFELLGIPQIFYEPLYCNHDRSQLVPNIYSAADRTAFEAAAFTYDPTVNGVARSLSQIYDENDSRDFGDLAGGAGVAGIDIETGDDASNPTEQIVFQDQIAIEPIFASNDFTCCIELGNQTDDSAKCCSNFSVLEGQNRICRLAPGVDLNVYFNKFVSSEGMGEDVEDLNDNDFIPETGEPRLTQAVYTKLTAKGREHCSSGNIRFGSSFGNFTYASTVQVPNGGDIEDFKIFSIVDSIFDADAANDIGTVRFLEGFKWGAHVYCEVDTSN